MGAKVFKEQLITKQMVTRNNINNSKGIQHTGQCKRTGGCYNELVVAFYSTGGGVKGEKIYTC